VAAFVKRTFHNLKQIFVPDSIRSVFIYIGIQYNIDVEPHLLVFDKSALRESPEFLAIWQRDYPLEQLALRRKRSRFGWVN
jgi:hypothetical protein